MNGATACTNLKKTNTHTKKINKIKIKIKIKKYPKQKFAETKYKNLSSLHLLGAVHQFASVCHMW